MSYSVERPQSPAGPVGFFRRLSARWRAEKVFRRARNSSGVETRGAAVPYQDPSAADDGYDADVFAQSISSSSCGGVVDDEVGVGGDFVDSENNEVFGFSKVFITQTSSSTSSSTACCDHLTYPTTCTPPQPSDAMLSPTEILSASSLMRRAQSVAVPSNHMTNGHHAAGQSTSNGSHRIGNGYAAGGPYSRSASVGQVQGYGGQQVQRGYSVFDVRREVLGSLAESGEAERLRAVLKTDNEAVNAADEVNRIASCVLDLGH